MPGFIIRRYKTPLLISTTLAIVVLAVSFPQNPLQIISLFLGALAGAFLLELDYLLYAFLLEPKADFSRNLRGYLKNHDLKGAISFVAAHHDDVTDKTLHNALFQMALAVVLLYVSATESSYLLKGLVLTAFACSINEMLEHYFDNRTKEWFWALKNVPEKKDITIYTAALLGVLIYSISLM